MKKNISKEILDDYLSDLRQEAEHFLALCESPAEEIFAAAAFTYFNLR